MELNRALSSIRRWWWLILAGTVLATVSGFIVARMQPPIYEAKATVMVGRSIENPNPSSNDLFLSQQLAQTYVEIASRRPVQEATIAALGIGGLPPYRVALVPDTQLLEIKIGDSDPQRAMAIANELANQLIKLSPNTQGKGIQDRREFLTQEVQDLENNINATRARVQELKDQLDGMFSAKEISDTNNQINALEAKLFAYQSSYADLVSILEGGANSLELIEPAVLPMEPISSNAARNVLVVASLGLALTLMAAFLLDYLEDTFKSPDEIRSALRLPTLGAVLKHPGGKSVAKLVATSHPDSPATESYRLLAANIQFAAENSLKSLLIASAGPDEGKTFTAAHLGLAMAYQGLRVVLLDTDLRRPTIHQIFDVPNTMGLTTALLRERPELEGFLQNTNVPGLRLLTSGPSSTNPARLIGSERFTHLLDDLKHLADIVVLDSPPVLAVADATILSRQVDGVVLVVDAANTRRRGAVRAVEMLDHAGATLLGVAFNRISLQTNPIYGYSYRYTSTEGSAEETAQQSPKDRRRWLPDTISRR